MNLYANPVPLRTLWLRSEGQQQLSGNKSSFLLQLAESHHRATLWHGASEGFIHLLLLKDNILTPKATATEL